MKKTNEIKSYGLAWWNFNNGDIHIIMTKDKVSHNEFCESINPIAWNEISEPRPYFLFFNTETERDVFVISELKTKKENNPIYKELDFGYWFDTFKPQTFTHSGFNGFINYRGEPVCGSNQKYSSNHLWTRVSEDGRDYLISGYHVMNATSYLYTEKAWDRKYIVKVTDTARKLQSIK